MKKYTDDPSIIELCTTCEKEVCPSNGCPEYNDRLKQLRNAGMPKKASSKAKLLKDLSTVITSLNALAANPDCDSVYSKAKIERLSTEISLARFNAYNNDINWDEIVRKMEDV